MMREQERQVRYHMQCQEGGVGKYCLLPWHTGVVQCKDSFYGQRSPQRMPVAGELQKKWEP